MCVKEKNLAYSGCGSNPIIKPPRRTSCVINTPIHFLACYLRQITQRYCTELKDSHLRFQLPMQCQSTHFTPSKGSTLYLCHDYFLEVNSLQSMYDHPSRFMLTLWIFVLAVEISYRSHALPHNLLLEKSTSPVFFKLEVSLKPQCWPFEGNQILF